VTNIIVEKSIWIEARPETVFSYFADARKLTLWMGRTASLDAREAGGLRIDMNGRDIVEGTFVAVEPYERIAFTWGWVGSDAHPPGSSLVEVTLRPEGGGTQLQLRHSQVPAVEADTHRAGWEFYFGRLRPAVVGAALPWDAFRKYDDAEAPDREGGGNA